MKDEECQTEGEDHDEESDGDHEDSLDTGVVHQGELSEARGQPSHDEDQLNPGQ